MLYNELDLLEMRLEILSGVVDKFVVVEANRTHTLRPKPLHFAQNASRFARFKDKIVHIALDGFPECTPPGGGGGRTAAVPG